MPIQQPNFSVQLQLLQACNLNCRHCYDESEPRARAPSTLDVMERIHRIGELCCELKVISALHLSGGEPTLRHDLPEIVDYAVNARGHAVLLFTNGTRWTPDYAMRLKQAGLRYVQVSLEGPEPINDEVRGAGTSYATHNTIHMLVDRGFRVTVSVTVTRRNYPFLEEFVSTLDPLDLHFHLREVLPLGAGLNCGSLTREQRRALFAWGKGYQGASTIGLEDPIHCSILPGKTNTSQGCVAGRSHFCVDVDGTIYPCRPLRWAVGHINDLRAAWYSPSMVRLRTRDFDGQCGRCQLKQYCGGCRVHALRNGNVFGEDTRCFARENDLIYSRAEASAIAVGTHLGLAIAQILRRPSAPH